MVVKMQLLKFVSLVETFVFVHKIPRQEEQLNLIILNNT